MAICIFIDASANPRVQFAFRPYTVKLKIALLLIIVATASFSAKADPLSFSNVVALQGGGSQVVDLFSSPGVILLGPQLTFRADLAGTLPVAGTDTFLATYRDATGFTTSQTFQIPLFETITPPFSLVFGFTAPNISFGGVPATLTIDLLNSSPDFVIPNSGQAVNSYTYSFNVAQPVPEPTTLALLGGGLVTLFLRRRRRH